MFKLPYNFAHFICQQGYVQNPLGQVSAVCEPRTSRYIKTRFRKGRGTRDQTANIHWIIEKAREFQRNIYICFIGYTKSFDCVDHKKLWKILKELGIPDHLTCFLRICMQVKKQQLELDMEQQSGSKSGKEHVKAVYCHSAYLTYRQCTSCKILGWMKHKLESILPGEISTPQICR